MCPTEKNHIEIREDIMKATFTALCKFGYADLTMQKIAEESDRCKSTLHYHYETKEKLMVDFIRYLLEGFKERIVPDKEDPLEKLNLIIDRMLFGLNEEKTIERFHTALLEIRSQAPYNDNYREQITHNDEFIHKKVEEIIEEGVKQGKFCDVDTKCFATLIMSSIDGARARKISTHRNETEKVRKSLNKIIEDLLLKKD